MKSELHHSPLVYLLMIAAVAGTLVVAVSVLRTRRSERPQPAQQVEAKHSPSRALQRGVLARITAGGAEVERTLPSLSFALTAGQSLDARIPSGPFEAEFTVRFHPGEAEFARFGAELQNGSVIVKQGESVLLSDVTDAKAKVALNLVPLTLARRMQELTYIFKSNGQGTVRMRALWQPGSAVVPLPIPSDGAPLLADETLRGMALVQQFNCAACHQSSNRQLQQLLAVSPAPNLADAGRRLKPEWIRQWLADPHDMNSDSQMPRVFPEDGSAAEQIEDITHFLVSLGGPLDRAALMPDPDIISTGMVGYHTVGCVACHGPLEPLENLPGARKMLGEITESYTPLGNTSLKTTAGQLAEMLRDPLKVYPSGRMPSLALNDLEAESIASYLIDRDNQHHRGAEQSDFELSSERVMRGREHFNARGCVNCHELPEAAEQSANRRRISAAPLESLLGKLESGCLSDHVEGRRGAPDFGLSKFKRKGIAAFLQSLPSWRNHDVPHDQLSMTIARLNCTACHQFHGGAGPEPAIAQYFNTVVEADLGDEGRLPPTLSEVGGKLNPGWLREMLEGDRRARPYMGVRMPRFGSANVEHLPADFACAAGVNAEADHGPTSPTEYAAIGRELVGSKGLNCIQCHTIAGRDSTGTPGPDLAFVSERLRFDAYSRWLHDPKLVRPGTRMPSFFVNGRSGFTSLLEGDADKQVQAIWAYLSLGEMLPLPEGLVEPGGLALEVRDEPIVFRTFIKQAGVRAIACGFPERLHCAFDADRCKLALVWQGDFLNAAGAWAARGGTQTNPAKIVWTANDDEAIRIHPAGQTPVSAELTFKGYKLDQQRRPIFLYSARAGGATVEIEEQPIPMRDDGQLRFIRRFSLRGLPGLGVRVHGTEITIDQDGRAEAELEVTW